MAPRQVLADLAVTWQQRSGMALALESVGGVDAAQRVQAGEAWDVVFLASGVLDQLATGGYVVAASKRNLMRSRTAVAVRQGMRLPDIASESALRAAVLEAPSLGYSTGPSGVALLALLERWGIAQQLRPRLHQARPGVPVAQMLAAGEVAIAFQQRSELLHQPGITVVGDLPEAVAIDTVFSGALTAGSAQAEPVRDLLAFMAAPQATAIKRLQGMEPV